MKKFWILFVLVLGFVRPAFSDSLDIKIGQMLLVGMQGHTYHEQLSILPAIQKGLVGGILFFEYNLSPAETRERLTNLTTQLQNKSLLGEAHLPLFLAIDQEGGQVNRMKPKYGFPAMPSAKVLGEATHDSIIVQAAQTMAATLSACGINLNFAPVADVHNDLCPVLGNRQRCFSKQAERVTYCDSILMEIHNSLNILTAMKHFPGHGNSRSDSHLGLTDITLYWKPNELIPYERLIAANKVSMIMSGHLVHKKLDEQGLPATLSKKILSDKLRGELQFKGVIVSDDMQMHAISSLYTLEESLYLGLTAGIDVFIFSNNIPGATAYAPENVHATIRRLVEAGRISPERINESYQRIVALKRGIKIKESE
ncbi:MAG: glycoside hydrolase family 3 protein [Chitinophagaceae bacterium]